MSDGNRSRTLYLNKERGRIAGVCAGLADYLGLETWVVRVITVSVFLLTGFWAIIIAYVVLALALEKRPEDAHASVVKKQQKAADNPVKEDFSVNKVWRQGTGNRQRIQEVEEEIMALEKKIRSMEAYVTSGRFELEREFESMSDANS